MLPPAAARLSRVWFPSGGIAASGVEDGHAKLIRAGFLRQSNAGMFHMLPLGRRVQDKVEGLVAGHMEEMLAYLLAPTHEEEITTLVARSVKSYKELPLRLYQITRKYRDEFRPRHGLLRGREFIMKDLYTFDNSVEAALETYHKVRTVYTRVFSDMKLPVLSAKASSGDMGGDLSHEYHLPTSLGEDRVVSCNSCDYVVNEEVAGLPISGEVSSDAPFQVWRGITKDRTKLVNVWYPRSAKAPGSEELREYTDQDINWAAVKSVVPDLDAGLEDALPFWSAATAGEERTAMEVVNVLDSRLPPSAVEDFEGPASKISSWPAMLTPPATPLSSSFSKPLNLLRIRTSDKCPSCSSGSLKVDKAMELGHTFFLGTRYSEPLGAMTSPPPSGQPSPMQMGCYGIGISRVLGAVAEHLADKRGLNWPVAIAPYSCVVIPGKDANDGDAMQLCHHITSNPGPDNKFLDVLTDADLIGFPVIILLGREWRASKRVEVQCRRLGLKQVVEMADLPALVQQLHASL
ncbi:hypothetical protein N0V88_004498 [Collariella sp. IMI 366227]|nr:hypothetical protein N0V88_004498 [Collariella sp. IMI 366227]